MAVAAPLSAQLKGLPVYPGATAQPAWVVAGDFGSGVNRASGRAHHLGGRLAGTLGPVGIMLGAGVWDAASGSRAQVGGTLSTRVFGHAAGALSGFAVGGAGTVRVGPSDTSAVYWTFPVGLALVRSWQRAGPRALTPWLLPRVQVDHVTFAGARASQLGAGLSAGVNADLTDHLGVHGALDWLHQFRWTGSVITLEPGERLTLGVGAYWRVSTHPDRIAGGPVPQGTTGR